MTNVIIGNQPHMKIGRIAASMALVSCGTPAEAASGARTTTAEFVEAHAAQDGAAACALLTPETRHELEQQEQKPCAEAVLAQDVPGLGEVRRTQVYGNQAVVVTSEQSVFLSQASAEWRVVAAGCKPRGGSGRRDHVRHHHRVLHR